MQVWEWTQQELAVRQTLAANISMADLFAKYSRSVESRGGGEWTHRCTCPNPAHKGGNERTPSCNFSEPNKRFHCFGCGISGDPFDLIAMMTGQSADRLVDAAIEQTKLDVGAVKAVQRVGVADFVRFNHRLSITLRDYLKGFRGTDCYEAEEVWVDQVFKRVDERFAKIDRTKPEAVKKVYDQVMLDFERRKTERESVCL